VSDGNERKSQESPWLPRPARPDGGDLAACKFLPQHALGSNGERCVPLADDVIFQLARLVAEAHDRNNGTN
jgi:hypothetical protein